MYGLPQAGIIAQELLEERLEAEGYRQSLYISGLWTHNWFPIQFTLVVDNFGVKYVREEHAHHLLKNVRKHYKCSCKMEGEQYCGLTLKWDYTRREVQIMMPGYVSKGQQQFDHPHPDKPQDQPHPHLPPNYGAKVQFAKPEDATRSSTKQTKNLSCKSPGRSYSKPVPSREQCSPPSVPSPWNKQIPQSTQCKMQTIPGQRRHPPQHGPHLPRQQHGPCHPLRRILPIQTWRPQPRRRPHVYGSKKKSHSTMVPS
jgi:hypothetical protein